MSSSWLDQSLVRCVKGVMGVGVGVGVGVVVGVGVDGDGSFSTIFFQGLRAARFRSFVVKLLRNFLVDSVA